jgi:mRNA interferase MazF
MNLPSPPKKWHVYIIDLQPRVGTKPGKRRPCLAIQPNEFAEAGLQSTVVIPLTTQLAKEEAYPLRIRVPKESCQLDRESELLIDQILAWDNSLFREDLGEIPPSLQEKVKVAIKNFLDLEE